jgi:hypothetical protein
MPDAGRLGTGYQPSGSQMGNFRSTTSTSARARGALDLVRIDGDVATGDHPQPFVAGRMCRRPAGLHLVGLVSDGGTAPVTPAR